MRALRLALALCAISAAALLSSPAAAASTKRCPNGTIVRRWQTCPTPTPAPAPTPTPAPAPAPTPTPIALSGLPPIPSNFDVTSALITTGVIPPSNVPDVVGAFRFICGGGVARADDPILYPGQPGRSHLHQPYGNTGFSANSTFDNLRATGGSTCNYTGTETAANRSAYWMPAMLDGRGHAVQPDYITVYYKRHPASDPKCSLTSGDPQAEGDCLAIPNGIRFIFGWDPTGINAAPTGSGYFNCDGPTAVPGHYLTITEAASHCPAGQGNRLGAIIQAPECWNGKDLDMVDHRSHVAYPGYGYWGYLKCPPTHPFVIPTFSQGGWYSVDAGDDPSLWTLSSDAMNVGGAAGSTFHADYFEAWDPTVKAMWTDNCINKMLNCSAGDLGNGKQLKGASVPTYIVNGVPTTLWKNPVHLVALPTN